MHLESHMYNASEIVYACFYIITTIWLVVSHIDAV